MDVTSILSPIMNSDMFDLIIIPILIFFARIIDVSIGTIKLVFITKGMKKISPVLGFFEVLVWLLAISQIMQNLTNFINYIAYAGGFAAGTYVGMYLEEKLAMGNFIVRVITKKKPDSLVEYLRSHGYGATIVGAQGVRSKSNIILTLVKRRDMDKIVSSIKKFNPYAFYSVEEVKYVTKGMFPAERDYKEDLRKILRKKK